MNVETTARGAVVSSLALPPAFGEMLTQLRAAHVRYLPGLVARLRTQYPEVAAEVLAEVHDAGVFGDLERFDAVVTGRKVHELQVAVVPNVGFGGSFSVEDIECAIVPFAWNECRVQARVDDPRWTAALSAWLATWLDPDDNNPIDMLGLSSVVHSVKHTHVFGGMLSFVVDFGSAPIECVADLFRQLVAHGATFVVVGERETLIRAQA